SVDGVRAAPHQKSSDCGKFATPLVPLVAAQRWRHSLLHAPESHTANAGPIRSSSRSRAPSWPHTPDVHTADSCGHEHCRQIVTAVCAAEGQVRSSNWTIWSWIGLLRLPAMSCNVAADR